MTQKETMGLYVFITTNWPQIVKLGLPEGMQRDFIRQLHDNYKEYALEEVMNAWKRWAENNSYYPTKHDIVNEILWLRREVQIVGQDQERYTMDFIDKDGYEWTFGSFTRAEFIDHPRNVNKLSPEEWRRRFIKTRNKRLEERQNEILHQRSNIMHK